MAIQIIGSGGVVADVDGTTFRALRITPRPVNYGSFGIYRAGGRSGIMAVSLAANAALLSFRWGNSTNLGLIQRVNISAGGNVAATTAVLLSFALTIARGFTASDTGGSGITPTGNSNKLRTSMATSLVTDLRIATTAGLGAGTRTLDGTNAGEVGFAVGTGAITVAMDLSVLPQTDLFAAADEGLMPIVLAQDEGFIVRNGATAWPAGLTWCFGANVAWAEAAAF